VHGLIANALSDRALATSAPLATLLDAERGVGHILDPRTGEPAARWRLASVSAPHAALADALSTAFCLMDRRTIDAALARHPDAALESLVS
jgi:thiamine biosynthesis lipoprotein